MLRIRQECWDEGECADSFAATRGRVARIYLNKLTGIRPIRVRDSRRLLKDLAVLPFSVCFRPAMCCPGLCDLASSLSRYEANPSMTIPQIADSLGLLTVTQLELRWPQTRLVTLCERICLGRYAGKCQERRGLVLRRAMCNQMSRVNYLGT